MNQIANDLAAKGLCPCCDNHHHLASPLVFCKCCGDAACRRCWLGVGGFCHKCCVLADHDGYKNPSEWWAAIEAGDIVGSL